MHYRIPIFLALTTAIFGQGLDKNQLFDIYSPVGDTRTCVNSVKDLLNASYQNYPSIKASKQMLLGAKAQVESANWNYFPTPSVDFSQKSGRNGTTFRLDQPLWTGGKLDAASEFALSKEDEAQYSLGENAYLLSEKVINVLQNYIRADGEIKGFKQGKVQLESFSDMLERRIEAGVSSESDRELLSARIAQIDSDIITAQAKYQMAQSQLNLLTGRPLQCAIGFTENARIKQDIKLEKLEQELVNNHPTLKKLEAQIAMAQAEKKSTDAAIMPNVSLRAEHQQGSVYANDIESDTLVYVNVSYSPGAGLSSLSNMESATYKVLQVKDELQAKERELMSVAIADYSDYRTAKSTLISVEQTIRSTQKVLDSYTRLFITGKRQWLDLVNISREVTQNKISLANLKAILIASFYRLELQMGNIDFENMGKR